MVYAGLLEGRSVAVKRMLVPFFELAHGEIALLMESDTHANVIRYFAKVRVCISCKPCGVKFNVRGLNLIK